MDTAPTLMEEDAPARSASSDQPGVRERPLIPPKENKAAVAGAVVELFERSYNYRALYNELWTTCVAFYEGQQWVRWNPLAFQLQYDRRVPFHMKPMVENHIGGLVDTGEALLTSEEPILSVRPSGTDQQARDRAEVGTSVVRLNQRVLKTKEYNRLLAHWLQVTGTALIESYWDPYAEPWEPEMGFTTQGWTAIPETDQDGKPVMLNGKPKPKMKPKGAIRRSISTSFEVFPDPGSTSPDNADWICIVTSMDPEEVHRRYGVKPKSAAAGYSSSGSGTGVAGRVGQILQRAFGLFGEGFSYSTTASGLSRAIDVISFHQAPCQEAPFGRKIVLVDGDVVEDDISPMKGRMRWPFTVFYYRRHGKRFFSNGIVYRGLDIQRAINRTISRFDETLALMGNPRIMADRALGINRNQWTNRPGLVLEFDSSGGIPEPKILEGVSMPAITVNHVDRLVRVLEDIFGVEAALQGRIPSAHASGDAIEALQGENKRGFTPPQQALLEGWQEVAQRELFLAGQHWDEVTKIEAIGRNQKPKMVEFVRTEWANLAQVQLENGDSLPQDPAARQAVIDRMYGPGGPMVTLPAELRRQYLGLSKHSADLLLLYDQESIFEERANMMVTAAIGGEKQIVNYNDHHPTARRVIAMRMQQQDFLEAPDDRKALVVDLDEQHAYYEQLPKDAQGIVLPPDAMALGAQSPIPGEVPTAPSPDPQALQAASSMAPATPPQPSPPKAVAG